MTKLGWRESRSSLFEHDGLQTWADWVGDPEELKRVNDEVDRKDHEEMYLEDYPDDVLDLEDTSSIEVLVQDRLGSNACQHHNQY